MYDKSGLRRAATASRRAAPVSTRDADDRALVVAAVNLIRGATRVSAYVPMPGEPGGPSLVAALAAEVPHLLLPVLLPDRDLDWAEYQKGSDLVGSGLAGMREPTGPRLGPAAIAEVEFALVPALAADRLGTRLGRGGGSYDRALARVPAETPVVALLYSAEIHDVLPRDAHDRPVTAILTPAGLRRITPWDEGAVGNTEWTNGSP